MTISPRQPDLLYDHDLEHSSCGVGFLTRKNGVQSHEVMKLAHQALCSVPHRGGMSSEGVGDGAGVCVDLSVKFFSRVTGVDLEPGRFGVGNFFMPDEVSQHPQAFALIEDALKQQGFEILANREVPVNNDTIRPAAVALQLAIHQWVFQAPDGCASGTFDRCIYEAMLEIESKAYIQPELAGLYPVSMSSRTQVFKGRLNSNELVPYYADLNDPDHEIHTLFFHTRFSTNTDPHPTMAQPFRMMAHNGELNTDKKNRLSEAAVARARNKSIIRPKGQSDSCRLDQTLQMRVIEDGMDLVTSVVSMMPPAWENDPTLSQDVRDMLAYFSLYEEKNDGPAALVFGDGNIIGARLDRLGLRPLRTTETDEYLSVMSEAGQIDFDPQTVLRRGRIEAGGMLVYNHAEQRCYSSVESLEKLAAERDYSELLRNAQVDIEDIPESDIDPKIAARRYDGDLTTQGRYVAYSHNQESFRFLMDPMLTTGVEKVSAMGYGNAISALSDHEGGVAKYFSQRFAQVTNPPLDSIREADGMTLRVSLGAKPHGNEQKGKQILLHSPVLRMTDVLKIRSQSFAPCKDFDLLYTPDFDDATANEQALIQAIDALCDDVLAFVEEGGSIALLTDRHITRERAAIPMILAVSAVNQRLIEEGLRLEASLLVESGQVSSAHHIACALGFGAAAVYPLGVRLRAEDQFADDPTAAYKRFVKAAHKSLMKTMGKVGLCTVESYSGGEFFEPNFLDTSDPVIHKYFPNMYSPVGGVGYPLIAKSTADWHERALSVEGEKDIPMLGLFKERSEGAGHSFGTAAVRGFVDMTEENILFGSDDKEAADRMRLLTLKSMEEAFEINEDGYTNTSFDALTPEQIDSFTMTPGYKKFSRELAAERKIRPVALRDVLEFPADISHAHTLEEFNKELTRFNLAGNVDFVVRGLLCEQTSEDVFSMTLTGPFAEEEGRLETLQERMGTHYGEQILESTISDGVLKLKATGSVRDVFSRLRPAMDEIPLDEVQPASEITGCLASGAMSHGALVASAHEAVAHGTNMAGGMSNSGEGGEHVSRYGTIRSSRIKQFASGRFGVWAGYLADSNLEEIEIKIGQGAKPGEGGQLPGRKVTIEIAAARGGTPGVELISPPPHHDTYSIEDLAQLIHDAKAARVKVIVKLVSSEGIGTIAVGVAKAGADVINVAGNTGGTGAAAVTSLKYTGRAAEIGVAEVHQALCVNGIRQKVILRCSGAHQTGSDVVKSCLLGADSYEFGTTALMMLKCVMAKNCNIKCPAGLTTNPEVFDGDPRALAQYLLNIAHEVRSILSHLGFTSLEEARGRTDYLHLLDHPASIGKLNLRRMLALVEEVKVEDPVYLERDFSIDDRLWEAVKPAIFENGESSIAFTKPISLGNRNKSVGGQLAIDVERQLNHTDPEGEVPAAIQDPNGRRFLKDRTIAVHTKGAAGQSYAAFCNNGLRMEHTGTCNDGVGKGACGGEILIHAPASHESASGENVLIGNFALFGATGGRCFVEGEAGDRFAVRNSGATAVVEGVGEFCCEYMTHGAVVNIGRFAKGLGNGMSGGFAYQYDPEGLLEQFLSKDSVIPQPLTADTPEAAVHEAAVQQLLQLHVDATGSVKARMLLDNWDAERVHFHVLMPKLLFAYQDANAIQSAQPRKALLEELSTGLASLQVAKMKKAWREGEPVLGGRTPGYGAIDTEEMFRLVNNYTVLNTAQTLAVKRLGGQVSLSDPDTEKVTKNLILTEDYALMNNLRKHAKAAIEQYSDEQLAVLIADNRLRDFKKSLRMRPGVAMDSPGTYGWILLQDWKNQDAIGVIPSFEELFAGQSMSALAASF